MTNGNIETRVSALETQMQEIRDLLLQTAQEQKQTAANITRLEATQERTQKQLENFIAASTRVMAKISDDASRADASSTQNYEVLKRLANKAESIEGRLVELVEYVRRGQP